VNYMKLLGEDEHHHEEEGRQHIDVMFDIQFLFREQI
jgi:hypothetical protein